MGGHSRTLCPVTSELVHRAVAGLAAFHADIAQDSPRLRYALECWTGLNRAATRRWLRGEATREATQELLASTLEHVLRTIGASSDGPLNAVGHLPVRDRPLGGPRNNREAEGQRRYPADAAGQVDRSRHSREDLCGGLIHGHRETGQPGDLFAFGLSLADVLDADGEVDDGLVATAVAGLLAARPGLGVVQSPPRPDMGQGGAQRLLRAHHGPTSSARDGVESSVSHADQARCRSHVAVAPGGQTGNDPGGHPTPLLHRVPPRTPLPS